jgi:uncharacterized protein (TIGR04141 family)
MADSNKIQAALYQIDLELFEGFSLKEVIDTVIQKANKDEPVSRRYKEEKVAKNSSDQYIVRVFYSEKIYPPKWRSFIDPLLTQESNLVKCNNRVYSYVCFIDYKGFLFACTGGLGSFAIDKYIVQDFGLKILVRLFQKNSKVIKAVQDRGFSGIVLGQKKFYRGDQRFADENSFGKVYKEVQAELNINLLTSILGFEKNQLKKNVSGCLAKSSFQINKAIDFDTLLRLVDRFSQILGKDENFSLNKVTIIPRRGIYKKLIDELNERLINVLFENCVKNLDSDFDFCHREFDKYLSCSTFRLFYDNKDMIDFDERITLSNLIQKLKDEGRLQMDDPFYFKHSVLEPIIEGSDGDGTVLTRGRVIDHIHGEVNYNGGIYFLIDGQWYKVHADFIEELNKECKEILPHICDEKLITELFELSEKENKFNCGFIGQPNSFVFDTITPDNIELCDILKYDGEFVYLIHVKKGFNNSIRDLAAQISIAAQRLRNDKLSGFTYLAQIEEKLRRAKYSSSDFMKKLGSQVLPSKGLKSIFEGKLDRNIIFCLAFVDTASNIRSLKDNIESFDSNVAKYSLLELRREIVNRGFDLKIVQLKTQTR